MRSVLVLVTLLLLTGTAAAPAHAQASEPRVVLAFQTGGGAERPVLSRLRARPALAIGLMSTVQGRYRHRQSLLDMSAGARTSASGYGLRRSPRLELRRRADGTPVVADWDTARRRAAGALADIRPGLLASSVPGGAAYVGLRARPGIDAVVAADLGGALESASLGPGRTVPQRVRRALRRHRFVVATLAAGATGDRALDALLADRRPGDLVIVVEQPPVRGLAQLLPVAVAGLRAGGSLTSSTTHLRGIVAGIDIPATVLGHLRVAAPPPLKGQRIRPAGARNLGELAALQARWSVRAGRRVPALLVLLLTWTGVVLLLGLLADRRGTRAGLRIGALGVLWLPSLLLLTGALAPGRMTELALLSGGSMALGALTDLAVRFPRAPVVPAAVALGAHTLDLALGSRWSIRSLLGVDPSLGARFYGVGNEFEAVLCVVALVGVGALLGSRSPRWAAAAFAATGIGLAAVVGSGRLGADVGGVLTIAAGAAVATVLVLPGGVTRRRLAVAVAAPALGLAMLAALELLTSGGAHFTRTILEARSGDALWTVVERRTSLAAGRLGAGIMPLLVAVALLAAAYAVRFRDRVYGPLEGTTAWTAGLGGAFAGIAFGSVVNDSGPVLLVFGTFVLAAATAYVRGAPPPTPSPAAR